ncbi:hypothetical protein [Xanthomonas sacchari]|uniref:hypothetical protein n=1 Tax=Xanthomonas sacchari TaxID=56458 RepID=UPI00225527BA|nr:hypothetical protein [Xanthomonas sacchari]MCW0377093.1 hypothetical protein [Xanthomonas sacchari]
MKNNTICLLDRNAVSEIENSLQGRPGKNYQKLKSLDVKGVFISPLLSIIEGNKIQNRTAEVLHACIDRESDAVSRFFSHARVDSVHLKNDAVSISLGLIGDLIKKQDESLEFVKALQENFVEHGKKEKVRERAKLALDLIRANSKQFADPCSLVGLATALGSECARQVLKPKAPSCTEHAFNAYADIEKISLMNYMRHLSGSSGHHAAYKLITFDKGLQKFSQMIRVTQARSRSTDSYDVIQYVIDSDVFLNSIPVLSEMTKFKAELKREISDINFIV